MFRYLNALLAIVVLGALPALSGCLGGGGGSTAAPMRAPEPAPQPMAEPAADPEPKQMAEPAADPEPKPMAEPAADPDPMAEPARAGIKSLADAWGLSRDDRVYDTVRRAGWSTIYDPTDDITKSINEISRSWIPGRNRGSGQVGGGAVQVLPLPDESGVRVRHYDGNTEDILTFESGGGRVSRVEADEAVFGRIAWDAGDDGNWTAWGWWLEFRGADFIANAPNGMGSVDAVAFVQGPEFQKSLGGELARRLPETGSAHYRGPAAGMFASWEGESLFHANRSFGTGTVTLGEFTGSVDLTMKFGGSTPGGWDGAVGGNLLVSRMEGVRTTPAGVSEKMVREFGASDGAVFTLTPANFDAGYSTLSFSGDSYTREQFKDWRPRSPVLGLGKGITIQPPGSWWGRSSRELTADGLPRRIAGVFEIEASNNRFEGGLAPREESATAPYVEYRLIGSFLAPLVE